MKENSILIFASEDEIHASSVQAELVKRGAPYTRLQFSKIMDCEIGFRIDGSDFEAKASIRGSSICSGNVKSIFWIKQPEVAPLTMQKKQDQKFAANEISHCFWNLWSVLNVRWINFPGHISRASFIPEQFIKAKKLDARVVPFLLSNDRGTVKDFVAKKNSQIYEPFSEIPAEICQFQSQVGLAKSRRYISVDSETVDLFCDPSAKYPLFLRRVPSGGRIHRYMLIGTKIFCYISGKFKNSVDFESMHQGRFEVGVPDVAVGCLCNKLRIAYKLYCAVFDFVAADGDVFFWGMAPSTNHFEWLDAERAQELSVELAEALIVRA